VTTVKRGKHFSQNLLRKVWRRGSSCFFIILSSGMFGSNFGKFSAHLRILDMVTISDWCEACGGRLVSFLTLLDISWQLMTPQF